LILTNVSQYVLLAIVEYPPDAALVVRHCLLVAKNGRHEIVEIIISQLIIIRHKRVMLN